MQIYLILISLITGAGLVLIAYLCFQFIKMERREKQTKYPDEVNEKLSMYYELMIDL